MCWPTVRKCDAKEFFTSLYSVHICECFRVWALSNLLSHLRDTPLQCILFRWTWKKHKISNCMSIWNWGFKPHICNLTVAEFNRKCWCYFSSLKDFPVFEEMIWKDTLSLKWGAVTRAERLRVGSSQGYQFLYPPGTACILSLHEAGIVVHLDELRTDCNSVQSDSGSKDFILIHNGSQGADA